MSRSADNNFAGARQATLTALLEEYHRRHGVAFTHAWTFDIDPRDLCGDFLEDAAQRLEGRSVREIGRALAPARPSRWQNRERWAWLSALGSWAITPLAAGDRETLIGIAHVLGLDARARSWGLRW